MRNVVEAAAVLRETCRPQCQGGGCSAQQRSPLEACRGPDPEQLFRPSATHLTECREAAERLDELKAREVDSDGLNVFADEMIKAIDLLKSLEWDDIRRERFNMTPPALLTLAARLGPHPNTLPNTNIHIFGHVVASSVRRGRLGGDVW